MSTPIKYCHYMLNNIKQRFFPITVEEAVYDTTPGGGL